METWAYPPQKDFSESLEWLTDIQRCKTAEYRQSIRMRPRQEVQFNHTITAAQFGQAKTLARDLGSDSLLVPLWQWHTEPGALASGTTLVPKNISDSFLLLDVGTSVMIWESASKWEVNAVGLNSTNPAFPYITLEDAITQNFTRPLLVPLRVGQFAQDFEATRTTSQWVECSARFRIIGADDHFDDYVSRGGLYSTETYLSRPVITDRSLASSGVREQFGREYEEVDSIIGGAYRYPTLSRSDHHGQFTWSSQTRAGARALYYWLHSRRGKWRSFWVPSWNKDITVTHEIASTDTSIEIADIGIRTSGEFPLDIMILTKAGARIYCRVTGATAGSSGKEVVGLSGQVGAHLYTWDIEAVCFLTPSRFDSDRIEINHSAGGYMTAMAPIVEVPA
jgi:hypothetical protein